MSTRQKVILIAVVGLILIFIFNYAYTQETITLSTYYPAPYGEYRKLAIGSSAGGYTAPASPNIDLVVEGNVGIGTTSPLDPPGTGLTVEGAKDTRVTIGDPTQRWSWSTGWAAQGDFSLIQEGIAGDRIYVKQDGNVGIGTTSPAGPAPNGNDANLNVNDIYLRSANGGAGGWLSAAGGGGGVDMVMGNMVVSVWQRTYSYTAPFNGTAYVIARGQMELDGNNTDVRLNFGGDQIDTFDLSRPSNTGFLPFTVMGTHAITQGSTYQIILQVGGGSGFGTAIRGAKIFISASE